MTQYISRRELDNQPIHLTDKQINQPYKVLEDFCSDFSLGEIRQLLLEGLQISVSGEDDVFRAFQKRVKAFDWYMRSQEALEAVFVLVNKRLKDGPALDSN